MSIELPRSRGGDSLRAWYASSIRDFLAEPVESIYGTIAANSTFSVETTQRDAWLGEIGLLRAVLGGVDGAIFFEFSIPRMGRRIDVVLLIGDVVFAIEFKVGATHVDRAAEEQVWDYALDLKNFHEASHALAIIPIAVATECASGGRTPLFISAPDGVCRPIAAAPAELRATIDAGVSLFRRGELDAQQWLASSYRPTPTIIEAARALYAQHSVEDIARYDAGAENLRLTSARIEEIVEDAKANRRKAICFVTGVPGAGKTLVGLNVATRRREEHASDPAVFLSGNGPLVAVLREALKRDERERLKRTGVGRLSSRSSESVKQFIQNVHHFRDEGVRDAKPPTEHVAVFDEAQRAWTRHELASWMKRKKGHAGWDVAEAEFLISTLDRHDDWATIVCLVGGGQEINRGEAGIDSWLDAMRDAFPKWRMHISSKLTDSEYAAGRALDAVRARAETYFDDCLHLSVSMRSFRAENVSAFVKALLDRDGATARRTYEQLAERYPLVVTRDLDAAKEWVRDRARGSERYGLVASSKAMRLKPHAIDVRVDVDPVHWFLNDRDDTRSSWYLEDAATEFQVQGLELDWTCVTWDGDLRYHTRGWGFHDFRGSKWQNVNNTDNQRYLLNAYRVLLTRARQGMVIFVPNGERRDATRPPEFYDGTYAFLRESGVVELR